MWLRMSWGEWLPWQYSIFCVSLIYMYYAMVVTKRHSKMCYSFSVDPPEVPTSVSLDSVTSRSLVVSWVAPSNNGGSPVTGYVIEYKLSSSAVYSVVSTTSTAHTLGGLLPYMEYELRIFSENVVGQSLPTSTVSVTTLSEGTTTLCTNVCLLNL